MEALRQEMIDLQDRADKAHDAWKQEGDMRRAAERKHKKVEAELAATQEELRERSEAASSAERDAANQQAAAQAERARVKDLTVRLASMEAEIALRRVGAGLAESEEKMEQDESEQESVLSVDQIIKFIMERGEQGCIDVTGMDRGQLEELLNYNFRGPANEITHYEEICPRLKRNLGVVMLNMMTADDDSEDSDDSDDVLLLESIVEGDGTIKSINITNILEILKSLEEKK